MCHGLAVMSTHNLYLCFVDIYNETLHTTSVLGQVMQVLPLSQVSLCEPNLHTNLTPNKLFHISVNNTKVTRC